MRLKSSLCRQAGSLTPVRAISQEYFLIEHAGLLFMQSVCVYVTDPLILFLQGPQVKRFPPPRERPSGAAPPRRPHGP